MDQYIQDFYKTEVLSKDIRAELKQQLFSQIDDSKEASILRSKFFTHAKDLILAGGDVSVIMDRLAMLIRIMDNHQTAPVAGVGFSPGSDCKKIIVNHLSLARETLDICVFTISDNVIANAIVNAYKKGVEVRIISDNEKALDTGSDLHELAELGIPVKIDNSPNHMHHKFSVSDKRELITGSYNWTRSAEIYNQENIIDIRYPETIRIYLDEFERLWKTLPDY